VKPKVVKHLTDMEIDEISLVDRGANQHATVAIAKRAPEEETMPELYTEDGTLLDENSLEDGQIVYDGTGNAYQFTADADPDEGTEVEEGDELEDEDVEDEDEEVEERELASVGKAFGFAGGSTQGPSKPFQPSTPASPFRVGAGLNTQQKKKPLGAMGGGAMPQRPKLGGAAARPTVAKSFSEQVLEELSKAYTDEDRDEVLSKAFAEVDAYKLQAFEAVEIAKAERDLRLTNEYIAKAAEYNVPVDASALGPVLYRMAETMSYEDCSVIHKCLEAAGEAIFEEVGFIGGGDNVDVLDVVNAQAQELVGKSAGTSAEDAWTAVLDENPAAYDEYLAQSRRGY
jgi:hypothetical protein